MALTNPQKYTILRYLGWPVKTIDPTSLSYSKILSDRLSVPEDCEDMLQELLDRVETIDEQLQAMVARSNVKQVDDIQFFENGSSELRGERKKVIREIACMLDFPIGPGAGGSSMFCVGV